MMSVDHTPGPWDCDLDYIVAPDPTGPHPDIYIAEIAGSGGEGRVALLEQQLANRQLIAASPRLLAACRMVVERWEHGDLAAAARACSDAIAEATDSDTAGPPPWETAYSVLLLYPDYLNDSGTETFYAFVSADDPMKAVTLAQQGAILANECFEIDPTDFAPLLVIEGHHHSEPQFNK